MSGLRRAARIAAHVIAMVLAAAWTAAAEASLSAPLFDLGRAGVGDVIVAAARILELSAAGTLKLAHMLAGAKLLLALFLLAAVLVAAWQRMRSGASDDALLDAALLVSALGAFAALPVAAGGAALVAVTGELILCALAGALLAFGRGSLTVARRRAARAADLTWDEFRAGRCRAA